MSANVKSEYRALSGAEKAASLILALGEDQASRIFALLDVEEIKELSQTMSKLGSVNADVLERLCVDFVEQLSGSGSLVGSYESTERLLGRVLGDDRVTEIMDEIRGPAGRTLWDKLGNVNEAMLANYLKNEYPQTVALVLSKIKPDHAARVLGHLPDAFAMEVIMRMLRMEAVQKDVLNDVERTLHSEFMNNLARTIRKDAHETIAEIFNNLDRQTESRFMSALEERSRDSAEKIKALMFTFEDLGRLDASSIQTLLRAVDKDKLAIALKGAPEPMREVFFANMSERAGKLLRDEMSQMGPIRLRDVDAAQIYMVQLAKDLADKGEIMLADKRGGEDELIY
jgi:flagellar motor switch protein FliG